MKTTQSNQNIYAYLFRLSAACCFDQDDTETCRPLRRHEWRYVVFIDHHWPCNVVEITLQDFQDKNSHSLHLEERHPSSSHGPAGPSFQPCSTVAVTRPFGRPRASKSNIVQVMSEMCRPCKSLHTSTSVKKPWPGYTVHSTFLFTNFVRTQTTWPTLRASFEVNLCPILKTNPPFAKPFLLAKREWLVGENPTRNDSVTVVRN